MRLIWFQRKDGLWNADCTCGASCCGVQFAERADFETWHIERADEARKAGNKYLQCGPKFPDDNQYLPKPLIFA